MNSLRKLAEDYYSFILKYDECFYNKYQKEEIKTNEDLLKIQKIFNETFEKYTRPYKTLTKGKEIEELECIFANDSEILHYYFRMFDYISDECYDLAEMELRKYYDQNNMKKSDDEITNVLIKCMEDNKFDAKIFSQELIEKSNLMKEADEIYAILSQVRPNVYA